MSETLQVNLAERSYPIHIQPGLFSQGQLLQKTLSSNKAVIITNEVVEPLYCAQLEKSLEGIEFSKIVLPDGEQYKTLEYFEYIIGQLLELHASRDTTLIALGGGVIGDLTGFVAASFQRGMPFIQIPTTLLSQVDSSVGGKTAVNHTLGKNMIGAFYQPKSVYIDTNCLSTLPQREFSAGMAEVIKYGVIYDQDFFNWLENNASQLKSLDPQALQTAIHRCCQIKADIVAQDERENGIRALLNLGHTFGHAIEAELGYGTWLHGEAVAAGIILASQAAELKGWLKSPEVCRIKNLIEDFDLPTNKPDTMNYQCFMKHMKHDKKVKSGQIRFVIPTSIGNAVVTDELDENLLQNLLD